MVSNHKPKLDMKKNLTMFLGDKNEAFVNWLFEYLEKSKFYDSRNYSSVVVQKQQNKVEHLESSKQTEIDKTKRKTSSSSELKSSSKESHHHHHHNHHSSSSAGKLRDSTRNRKNDEHFERSKSYEKIDERSLRNQHASEVPSRKLRSAIGQVINPIANAVNDYQRNQCLYKNGGSGKKFTKRNYASDASDEDRSEFSTKRSRKDSDLNKRLGGKNSYHADHDDRLGNYQSDVDLRSDIGRSLDESNKNNDEPLDSSLDMDTKFLVTLNGVNKNMFSGKVADNELLDDEFDPELMKEDVVQNIKTTLSAEIAHEVDVSVEEDEMETNHFKSGIDGSSGTPCKYWPKCLNGSNCEFTHPKCK